MVMLSDLISNVSDLVDPGRNEADENEILSTAIHELVLFIARNENNCAAGNSLPFTIFVNSSDSGVNKNFMFPFMGVARCKATWGKSEGAHAEVLCLILFAY